MFMEDDIIKSKFLNWFMPRLRALVLMIPFVFLCLYLFSSDYSFRCSKTENRCVQSYQNCLIKQLNMTSSFSLSDISNIGITEEYSPGRGACGRYYYKATFYTKDGKAHNWNGSNSSRISDAENAISDFNSYINSPKNRFEDLYDSSGNKSHLLIGLGISTIIAIGFAAL